MLGVSVKVELEGAEDGTVVDVDVEAEGSVFAVEVEGADVSFEVEGADISFEVEGSAAAVDVEGPAVAFTEVSVSGPAVDSS